MSKAKIGDAEARGSREVWLTAAYDSLLEGGVDAVRVAPVAERLGLSRTSFYWFFSDRQELLSALIELWRTKNTRSLIQQTSAYAETITEAVLNVFDCWIDLAIFDSQLEFVVRSWAQQSQQVASEIVDADAGRITALQKMFVRFAYDGLEADVRARTVYLTQIGYISMQTKEDLPARMARIPDYVRIFTGDAPSKKELARFFARHNYGGTVGSRRDTKKASPAP